jgi:hypothetical protein
MTSCHVPLVPDNSLFPCSDIFLLRRFALMSASKTTARSLDGGSAASSNSEEWYNSSWMRYGSKP